MLKTESPPIIEDLQDKMYQKVLSHLNSASIRKFYNPFLDIDWDQDDYKIRVDDPRWERPEFDALGSHPWYQALPAPLRSELALDLTTRRLKTGIEFEGIVIRGLMNFSHKLPNRSTEYRYAMHECIEEIQHSLMFQEFINRSPFDPPGFSKFINRCSQYMVRCGSSFPELFFIFVLGGEGPIDYDQRMNLKLQKTIHPLMKKINQIHVTEEARHIKFAQSYLKQYVPQLSAYKRLKLQILIPLILGNMAKVMLHPPSAVVRKYNIPKKVVQEAYVDNPSQYEFLIKSMESITKLCDNLELIPPRLRFLWRKYNLIR
jgi:hypothetical protein